MHGTTAALKEPAVNPSKAGNFLQLPTTLSAHRRRRFFRGLKSEE